MIFRPRPHRRRLTLEGMEHRRVLAISEVCVAQQEPMSDALVASEQAEGEDAIVRHLVLVSHGWNSNADDWPDRMQSGIAQQLQTRPDVTANEIVTLDWSESQSTIPFAETPVGVNELWEVVTFDWRTSAATSLPTDALKNATSVGARYADQIIQRAYSTIHLIAHSAGSGLIDSLGSAVEQATPTVFTQLTFLDAFTPGNESQTFGTAVDWAEHFVDKGVLPFTNENLAQAVNIDLSIWGPSTSQDALSFGVRGHSWPWEFYLTTINQPLTSLSWGFTHSINFNTPAPPATLDGTVFVLGQAGDANDDGRFDSSDLIVMFQFGKFETGQAAVRVEGDWDGNGRFDTSDLVVVFQAGLYQA